MLNLSREQMHDILSKDNAEALMLIEQFSLPCGDCQFCCEILRINTFNKPNYQKCPKQCSSGCSIHDTKPDECRSYFCFWKTRCIDEDMSYRPDNLGALFDFENTSNGPVIRVWQSIPDMVLNNPKVREAAITLAHEYEIPLIAFYKSGQRSIFLIPSLKEWRAAFQKRFPNFPVYDFPEKD